jgi:hypothetical protein
MNRSFESFSGLIGRDKDKERIINLLAAPSKVDDAHPFVLPIVGMGGLGKTSLAKSVCDDENVKSHFDLKMEACVSDEFSLKQVIQKIIKSATGERCADLDEGELHKKLEDIMKGKKYLLLLDDVWNEDAEKWLLLRPLLSKGADGGHVLHEETEMNRSFESFSGRQRTHHQPFSNKLLLLLLLLLLFIYLF